MLTSAQPEDRPGIQFGLRSMVVDEYKLTFSVIDFDHTSSLSTTFPRIGYTVLNLFIGDNFTFKFTSYGFPEVQPGRLYIIGLLSDKPLIFSHAGKGKGYALAVHPVVAYHLLQEPMHQLNAHWDTVSNLRWKDSKFLRTLEDEYQFTSIDDVYLKQFLKRILPKKSTVRNDPIYHAVNSIIHRKGLINVKQLASDCCMTERTLNRQFLRKVGLSPKSYAKIWQLQYVMQLLQNPARSLSDLALKAGYYDAAHMAREFKNRLLQTPTEFLENTSLLLKYYLASSRALK